MTPKGELDLCQLQEALGKAEARADKAEAALELSLRLMTKIAIGLMIENRELQEALDAQPRP